VPGHPCIDELPLSAVLDAVERLATPTPAGAPHATEPLPAQPLCSAPGRAASEATAA
jgi:hypothetical protein